MIGPVRCAPQPPSGTCSDVATSYDVVPAVIVVVMVVVLLVTIVVLVQAARRRRRG